MMLQHPHDYYKKAKMSLWRNGLIKQKPTPTPPALTSPFRILSSTTFTSDTSLFLDDPVPGADPGLPRKEEEQYVPEIGLIYDVPATDPVTPTAFNTRFAHAMMSKAVLMRCPAGNLMLGCVNKSSPCELFPRRQQSPEQRQRGRKVGRVVTPTPVTTNFDDHLSLQGYTAKMLNRDNQVNVTVKWKPTKDGSTNEAQCYAPVVVKTRRHPSAQIRHDRHMMPKLASHVYFQTIAPKKSTGTFDKSRLSEVLNCLRIRSSDDQTVSQQFVSTADGKTFSYNEALKKFTQGSQIATSVSESLPKNTDPTVKITVTLTSGGKREIYKMPQNTTIAATKSSLISSLDLAPALSVVAAANKCNMFVSSDRTTNRSPPFVPLIHKRHRIFVTYHSSQSLIVKEICNRLSSDFDITHDETGDAISEYHATEKKLSKCEAALICYSERFGSCGNCVREAVLIAGMHKPFVGVQLVEHEKPGRWLLELLRIPSSKSFIRLSSAFSLETDVVKIKRSLMSAVNPKSGWRQFETLVYS